MLSGIGFFQILCSNCLLQVFKTTLDFCILTLGLVNLPDSLIGSIVSFVIWILYATVMQSAWFYILLSDSYAFYLFTCFFAFFALGIGLATWTINQRFPHLGFNLLAWLTELKRTVYLLDFMFITKDIKGYK